MNWHVEPVNDLILHDTNSIFCECKPKVEMQDSGNLIVVHNSWDGREEFEKKELNGRKVN